MMSTLRQRRTRIRDQQDSIVADTTIGNIESSYRTLKGPAKFIRRFATCFASGAALK